MRHTHSGMHLPAQLAEDKAMSTPSALLRDVERFIHHYNDWLLHLGLFETWSLPLRHSESTFLLTSAAPSLLIAFRDGLQPNTR